MNKAKISVFAAVILTSLITTSVAMGWSTYPGTSCQPQHESVDHAYWRDELLNSGAGAAQFYCPLVTTEDKYWTGSYNAERHAPANQSGTDDVYVTVDDQNNDSSGGSVSCMVGRFYFANTSYTEFSAPASTSSSGTGRSNLAFDFDTEFTSTSWSNHYIVECEVPGYDVDASSVIAVRARYSNN